MQHISLADRCSALAPEGAYEVLAQAQKLEREGKKIIHFEIGQPDFDTPNHIKNAAIKAIRTGKTRYTPSLGMHEFRVATSKFLSKFYESDVPVESVAVTPSAKTAIFAAVAAVAGPGDEVMYPDPGFPTYKVSIDFFGAKAVPMPLLEERKFSFDIEHFKKHFNKRTKAIILNSPSNPTGGIIPKKDLQIVAEMVKGTNCWILSDEIYKSLYFTKEKYTTIYTLPGMKNRTIIIDGFSKAYAMTGWRLGYLIVPPHITEKVDYLLTHIAGGTAQFTQIAGTTALTASQAATRKMERAYYNRRNLIVKLLRDMPGVSCVEPEGAFYAFPNIKSFKKSSKEIANYILHEAGVAVLPGTAFGDYGEGYLRICFANGTDEIKKGMDKMRRALEKLSHT